MCYYVASKISPEEIFQLEHDFVLNWEEAEYDGYYAAPGFSHPLLPVITAEKEFKRLSWGLVPAWVKDQTTATKLSIQTLNAMSETVESKPSFRTAVKEKRFCIVPVNGYYEWHHHANGEKYPFFIYPKNDKLFLMAGLYEHWRNPATGKELQSFTVLTTEANERLAWIHNSKKRMPVILNLQDAKRWIDPLISFADKQSLLKPFPQEEMLDHSISKLITSRKENPNQAAVLEPFVYSELNSGFDF